jgi:hypothetical protein
VVVGWVDQGKWELGEMKDKMGNRHEVTLTVGVKERSELGGLKRTEIGLNSTSHKAFCVFS